MRIEDVPEGDRTYPGDKCAKCGAEIEIYEIDDDIVYLSCTNSEGDDGHDESRMSAHDAQYLGWEIEE